MPFVFVEDGVLCDHDDHPGATMMTRHASNVGAFARKIGPRKEEEFSRSWTTRTPTSESMR